MVGNAAAATWPPAGLGQAWVGADATLVTTTKLLKDCIPRKPKPLAEKPKINAKNKAMNFKKPI